MPVYQFQPVDGGPLIERHFPFDKAPTLGSLISEGGRFYKRVFSTGVDIGAGVSGVVHQYPYESKVLPRGLEGCKTNGRGQPIIQSRQHEREVCARHDYIRE